MLLKTCIPPPFGTALIYNGCKVYTEVDVYIVLYHVQVYLPLLVVDYHDAFEAPRS